MPRDQENKRCILGDSTRDASNQGEDVIVRWADSSVQADADWLLSMSMGVQVAKLGTLLGAVKARKASKKTTKT